MSKSFILRYGISKWIGISQCRWKRLQRWWSGCIV